MGMVIRVPSLERRGFGVIPQFKAASGKPGMEEWRYIIHTLVPPWKERGRQSHTGQSQNGWETLHQTVKLAVRQTSKSLGCHGAELITHLGSGTFYPWFLWDCAACIQGRVDSVFIICFFGFLRVNMKMCQKGYKTSDCVQCITKANSSKFQQKRKLSVILMLIVSLIVISKNVHW